MSINGNSYTSTIRKKFWCWSRVYDLVELFPLTRRLRQLMVEKTPAGQRILDLCTGTGAVAFALAKRFPRTLIIGLDLSPDMLQVAQKKNIHFSSVFFVEGTAEHLPFPDGGFDAITISFALHEMPKDLRIGVLAEARRVLKKAGRLIVLDAADQADGRGRIFYHLYLKLFEPKYVWQFLNEKLEETIRASGFSKVVVEHPTRFSRLLIGEKDET